MADSDVILGKVASIDRCLQRILEVTHHDPETLDKIDIQDIFVLNLQRASQCAIDLAAHLVSELKLGLPTTLAEAFVLLQHRAQLPTSLSKSMQAMVGFRNIAVHAYDTLDPAILKDILVHRLDGLRQFCTYVDFLEPTERPK